MKLFVSFVTLVCLAACGGGDAVVRGDFGDDVASGLHDAWAVGREGRAEIADGRFELRGVAPGMVDVRLGGGDAERGRILIQDLPSGAELTLHAIQVDPRSGLATPARIELSGGDVITINGIRMAAPGRLRGRVREDATVLALSASGGALLARAHDERLPDLRVVVTEATDVVTPDGDPAPLDRLRAGDSIRVEGSAQEGYVIASRVVVPRRSATRSATPEGRQSPDAAQREQPPAQRPASTAPAAAGGSEARPRPPRDERGRGREGRGRGRDRDD
jgi:hypothetical protein